MLHSIFSRTLLAAALTAALAATPVIADPTMMASSKHSTDPALATAVANPKRTKSMVARDPVRHPLEELTFFGIKPAMTVVEIWPGGGYWTEILGTYLKPGTFYVAMAPAGEEEKVTAIWRERVAAQKDSFATIHETVLGAGKGDIAPAGSADLVLTFRNLHNWMDEGYADDAMAAIFKALKPGGILGIEEHRGRNDKPQDPKAKDGYVREDYTIALAKKAGFVQAGSSEINANPKDTKDYPEGVWTLPPSLALGEKDKAKYVAIGEADNYVLKFRKPK